MGTDDIRSHDNRCRGGVKGRLPTWDGVGSLQDAHQNHGYAVSSSPGREAAIG
ncbi:hypothetical protein AN958_02199 [Leucoagaricus sp. SymC.cos]|nr:hypothetical protein AN958_02199 [Leucoagaricus sp. SymC.cos]